MNKLYLLPLIALAGCKTIDVGFPPPPQDSFICAELPNKPDLEPLDVITLNDGRKVYSKPQVDARDAEIAYYIVGVRGAFFSCKSALQFQADYWDGLE